MILLILLVSLYFVFLMMTKEVVYDLEEDKSVYNRDKHSEFTRSFVVDKKEYPFESNWFKYKDAVMHYIDEGQGTPVLLCHGNPEWSFIYRKIIKEMKEDCRLIAYDLPGYGFSKINGDFDFRPEIYTEYIEALINHLKLDKFIIVVQDWGGPTGLSFAVNNPDKISGLILSNTWGWHVNGQAKLFSNVMKLPFMKRLVLNRNIFAEKFAVDNFKDSSTNGKSIKDAYTYPFENAEKRLPTAIMPTMITKSKVMLNGLESKLHKLSHLPIEMIFGRKDFALGTEEIEKKWLSFYPHAVVQIVEDAGHFTQEDSPESFIRSLKRLLNKIN